MKSNIANILRRLTVPFDAKETDPRIVIATDDPLSAGVNRAAISFYWDQARGFVAGVDRAGDGPSALGQWRLYGLVTGFGLSQFINATYDPTDGGRDNVSIRGGSRDPRASRVSVTGPVVDLGATTVGDDAGRDVRVFGQSMPRGVVTRSTPVTVAPFPTASAPNALLVFVPPATYRAGRAYEVTLRGRLSAAATPAGIVFRVRKGATAVGTIIARTGAVDVTGTGLDRYLHLSRVFTTGASDVTTDLCLTGDPTTGTAVELRGTDGDPLILSVTDIGSATDHPGYLTLI